MIAFLRIFVRQMSYVRSFLVLLCENETDKRKYYKNDWTNAKKEERKN